MSPLALPCSWASTHRLCSGLWRTTTTSFTYKEKKTRFRTKEIEFLRPLVRERRRWLTGHFLLSFFLLRHLGEVAQSKEEGRKEGFLRPPFQEKLGRGGRRKEKRGVWVILASPPFSPPFPKKGDFFIGPFFIPRGFSSSHAHSLTFPSSSKYTI